MGADRAVHGDLDLLVAGQGRFLAYLTKRLGDRAAAEDVLHDAYVKALASRARLRDRSSVVSWFFRVLERALVDRHRRTAVRSRALAQRAHVARERVEREARGLRDAVCACVEGLLSGLGPKHSEILRRVDLEGATPAEAAQSLGLTPGNAAVRLHRARAALRERLEAVCGTCTRHHCLDCHCE